MVLELRDDVIRGIYSDSININIPLKVCWGIGNILVKVERYVDVRCSMCGTHSVQNCVFKEKTSTTPKMSDFPLSTVAVIHNNILLKLLLISVGIGIH